MPALTVKAAASLVRYPERVEFRSGFGRRLDVQQSGRSGYLNLTRNTSLRGVGQRTLARITVEKGESWITQEVPLDLAMGWAGSPTAFSKNIAGSRFNVYHYLHIKALTQLYEFTGLPALEMWRDRWLGYTEKWPQFPLYSGDGIRHGVVDHGSYADAAAYLRDARVKLRRNKIERLAAPDD